jgi:hypothetical protein
MPVFQKRMLRAPRMTSRVSLIGMPRPHPSLERLEMDRLGSLRPIRVDHTKFSEVAMKQQHQLVQVLRRLDILCQVPQVS